MVAITGDWLPPALDDLAARISPRPLFLIYATHGQGGENLNPRYYEAAGEPKQLWEITSGGHTGGLEAQEHRIGGQPAAAAEGDRRLGSDPVGHQQLPGAGEDGRDLIGRVDAERYAVADVELVAFTIPFLSPHIMDDGSVAVVELRRVVGGFEHRLDARLADQGAPAVDVESHLVARHEVPAQRLLANLQEAAAADRS